MKRLTSRHDDASAAYDREFRRWAATRGKIFNSDDDSPDGVLFLLGIEEGSPVYGGLEVIHDLVFRIARACDGDDAYASDNEDDVYLVKPWSDAALALEGAALALGAPQSQPKKTARPC